MLHPSHALTHLMHSYSNILLAASIDIGKMITDVERTIDVVTTTNTVRSTATKPITTGKTSTCAKTGTIMGMDDDTTINHQQIIGRTCKIPKL